MSKKERQFYCDESVRISTASEDSEVEDGVKAEASAKKQKPAAGAKTLKSEAAAEHPAESKNLVRDSSKLVDKEEEIVMEDDSVSEVKEYFDFVGSSPVKVVALCVTY
jgi:hypothetical protein